MKLSILANELLAKRKVLISMYRGQLNNNVHEGAERTRTSIEDLDIVLKDELLFLAMQDDDENNR